MKTKTWTITLSITALMFVLTANFSIWLNNSIFDRQAFVNTTVQTIQEPQARKAISGEIVGTAFKSLPIVQGVVGEPLQSAINGLLGSERFKPILEGLAEKLNIMLTAKTPQSVVVDISGLKTFIKPIAGALDKQLGQTIPVADLPDSLVLIAKGEIPSIYSWAVVLLWVGPILGLLGLAIIIGLIRRSGNEQRPETLKTIGSILAVGSLVFIVLIKVLKAPILASVSSSNAKIVVGDLFDAFAGALTRQTWLPAIAGLVLIGVGYLITRVKTETTAAQKLKEAA